MRAFDLRVPGVACGGIQPNALRQKVTIAPPYVKWRTGAVTNAQAAAANLPPAGFHGTEAIGVVPVPMDEQQIPKGYTLTAGLGAILQLVANAAPASSGSDAGRTLAGVQAILAHLGLPPV